MENQVHVVVELNYIFLYNCKLYCTLFSIKINSIQNHFLKETFFPLVVALLFLGAVGAPVE